MSYSIAAILHPRKDKNNQQKVQIRIIYNRIKSYIKTDVKVESQFFDNGIIVRHPKADKYNANIRKKISDVEDRLLEELRDNKPDKSRLKQLMKEAGPVEQITVHDYILEFLERAKNSYSPNSIKHYKSVANKIEDYAPGMLLNHITVTWLQGFENDAWDKGLDQNTVNNIMKRLKALLNKCAKEGLIKVEQFESYKVPAYKQKLIQFLTEKEISKIHSLVKVIDAPGKKTAGHYFLLSCYTGYRLSDCKAFNYGSMVQNNKILLRAKKNGSVVSIPIHTRLKEVLKFIKNNPFNISEQKARDYIRELCRLKGITKPVNFHTGRHSWAMMLMTKGFTVDEVAETLGDTPTVARVYAKIHNESLSKKIRQRLK